MVNMGLGKLGENVTFRRKPRYSIELQLDQIQLPETTCKITIDHEAKVITTIFYNSPNEEFKELWALLSKWYQFEQQQEPPTESLLGSGKLRRYEFCGSDQYLSELYLVSGIWPTSVNFGDLDHSSSDLATVEVMWRYHTLELETHAPNPSTQVS